jgi:hypothetical protein
MGSNIAFQRFAARLGKFMEVSIENGGSIPQPGEILSTAAEEQFHRMVLELFNLQFQHNAAYRKICQARDCTPTSITHWTDIPTVPSAAFKELDLTCLPPDERTTFFLSSGTTDQKRSRHWHSSNSLAVYEKSLLAWFRPHLLAAPGSPLRLLVLTPPKASAPNSSLVHMFDTVARDYDPLKSCFVGRIASNGSWELDLPAATNCLRRLVELEQPVSIIGTAFSFVHLLDGLLDHHLEFELPPGSCALETGGYKGLSRSLPKAELHRLISTTLGIPEHQIVCEYGMAELSSQAYDRLLQPGDAAAGRGTFESDSSSPARSFFFPPWARAQLISPETGWPVGEGETGLIRVVDLANVYSVMGLQTEDLAIRHGAGFELLGRALQAEPRGCSMMVSAS